MTRRQQIAAAGIQLIAQGGTHRLTHRAIDAELQLPPGSTSYYARTRRDLLRLIVDHFSTDCQPDLAELIIPERLTVSQAGRLIADLVAQMATRQATQAARFALMFEVRDDEELRQALTAEAPIRPQFTAAATRLLAALGIHDPDAGTELVALTDALQMYHAVHAAPVDIASVITNYLAGRVSRAHTIPNDDVDHQTPSTPDPHGRKGEAPDTP